jgi:hypothetical protein
MTSHGNVVQSAAAALPHEETTWVRAAVALGATAVSVLGLIVGVLRELLDSAATTEAAWVTFLLGWVVALIAGAMAFEQGKLHDNRRDHRAGLVAVSYFPIIWALMMLSWWVT